MTAGLTEKDFAGVTAENAATVGQKLYIQYGITGVRGQVEAGLPAVLNVGLPVLEEGLAKGYDFDRVGGGALLAILANSTDTNIIARSSRERQLALTEELKALLAQTPYPDKDALAALDDRFIADVNRHVEALLLQQGKAMHDGKKLSDVVGSVHGTVVENLLAAGNVVPPGTPLRPGFPLHAASTARLFRGRRRGRERLHFETAWMACCLRMYCA